MEYQLCILHSIVPVQTVECYVASLVLLLEVGSHFLAPVSNAQSRTCEF